MENIRIKEPSELTEKVVNEIFEFARESSFLSDEEYDAANHLTPMTQELFEGCFRAMIENDSFSGFCGLNEEFPDHFKAYIDKLDSQALPPESPEEKEEIWEKLCTRIREAHKTNIC